MRYKDEIDKIIVRTEGDLRRLLEQALSDRSYADVAHIASLANVLSEAVNANGRRVTSGNGEQPLEDPPTRRARKVTHTSSRASRRVTRAYPRFERDGRTLVKIGWSKKARREYKHRAPREAVAAFADHLSTKVKAGKTFVIDDVLPLPDGSGGEVPSYQVYLALAWLQRTGVILKKGRDGYKVHNETLTSDRLGKLWEELPKHADRR